MNLEIDSLPPSNNTEPSEETWNRAISAAMACALDLDREDVLLKLGRLRYKTNQHFVPEWVKIEIRETWEAAREVGSPQEAFLILERMVDRIGYGRIKDNPSLAFKKEVEVEE